VGGGAGRAHRVPRTARTQGWAGRRRTSRVFEVRTCGSSGDLPRPAWGISRPDTPHRAMHGAYPPGSDSGVQCAVCRGGSLANFSLGIREVGRSQRSPHHTPRPRSAAPQHAPRRGHGAPQQHRNGARRTMHDAGARRPGAHRHGAFRNVQCRISDMARGGERGACCVLRVACCVLRVACCGAGTRHPRSKRRARPDRDGCHARRPKLARFSRSRGATIGRGPATMVAGRGGGAPRGSGAVRQHPCQSGAPRRGHHPPRPSSGRGAIAPLHRSHCASLVRVLRYAD